MAKLYNLNVALAFLACVMSTDQAEAGFEPIPNCDYIAGELKQKIRALQDGYTYDGIVHGYMGEEVLRFENSEGDSIDLFPTDAFIASNTYSGEYFDKNFGPEFIEKLRALYSNNMHNVNTSLSDISACYSL